MMHRMVCIGVRPDCKACSQLLYKATVLTAAVCGFAPTYHQMLVFELKANNLKVSHYFIMEDMTSMILNLIWFQFLDEGVKSSWKISMLTDILPQWSLCESSKSKICQHCPHSPRPLYCPIPTLSFIHADCCLPVIQCLHSFLSEPICSKHLSFKFILSLTGVSGPSLWTRGL